MPFPNTWDEELIIEWLHLDGFLVEANFPVGVSSSGSRLEADVIGVRITDNNLNIFHIEAGFPSGSADKNAETIKNKFSPDVKQSVIDYFKQILSFEENKVKYQSVYIAKYLKEIATNKLNDKIKDQGIEVVRLPDFIAKWVLPTIERWKQNPPHQPSQRGSRVTLPNSYWLLQLIDCLKENKLLRPVFPCPD